MDKNRSQKVRIDRRTALEGISLAGIGGLVSSGIGSAATNETYEVHLWQTDTLAGEYDLQALDNAKMHLEEAMARTRNDIDVVTHSSTVRAPQQNAYESFTAEYPCGDYQGENNYGSLLPWWKDYHNCNGLTSARDTNVLLTSTDSVRGGVSYRGGPFTVVQTGQYLGQADTYVKDAEKSNDVQNGVEGLLHEVGHAFQMTDSEADDAYGNPNYGTHKTGVSYDRPYGTSITPLGHGAQDDGVNECNKDVGTLNGFEQTWSDCTQTYWASSG